MKTVLFFAIVFISFNSYSQLEVLEPTKSIEIGKVGAPMMPVDFDCNKTGDTYLFSYKDIKFQHLNEYKTFEVVGEKDFESLYELISDGLKNQPEDDIMIKLDKGYLWLKFKKSFGRYVQIAHSVDENADVIGFSRWLTQKQIDKLFGKR